MKYLKPILAVLLSVTLLFQTYTVAFASGEQVDGSAFSAAVQADNESVGLTNESDAFSTDIVCEIEDQRTAFTKEYILKNGLHMAVTYPDRVHYEVNGKWMDIDNTLKAADGYYKNSESPFSVFLPEKLTENEVIRFSADGYEISFRLFSAAGKTLFEGVKEGFSKAVTAAEEKDDDAFHPERMPKKLSSRLTYEELFQGTDLIYDLDSMGLKEYILLEKPESVSESYTFQLNTGELIPVLYETGEIRLVTDKDESVETAVLTLPAPYVIDSVNETSSNVKVFLEKKEEGSYLLTYTLPIDWLNAEERVYPVALDPAIQTEQARSNIEDRVVYQTYNASPSLGVLEAGKNPGYGLARSFVRFVNLPAITSSDVVVKADFWTYETTYRLPSGPNGSTTYPIEIHRVESSWDRNTVTWDTQPEFSWAVEDETDYRTDWFYHFDITELARSWYQEENYGLAITLPKSFERDFVGSYRQQFWSSSYSVWQTVQKPTAVIYFRNNNGLESYWDYESASAGQAGTGYVNTFTGNLVFSRFDLGFSGNRMPVSISHVYNLNDVNPPSDDNNSNDSGGNTFHLGYGWRTNYHQLVYEWEMTDPHTAIPLGIYYVYEDADGTDHYFFENVDGEYVDEDGLGLTLEINGTQNAQGDYSSVSGYCISDKNGNTFSFDASGRLIKLENNQETKSSIVVTYNGDSNEINTVTDGVGRRYVFSYTNGLLSRISYYGTGNDVLTYEDFSYTNGNLSSVTEKDGTQSVYTYDGNRLLIAARDTDGYQLNYTYTERNENYQPYRVLSVEETDESAVLSGGSETPALGGKISFTYGHNETTLTDHNGTKTVLQFNDFGNVISEKDDFGNALFMQYAFHTDEEKEANTDPTKKGNQVRVSSDLQYSVTNKARGHGMESGITYWNSYLNATFVRTTAYSFADDYSIKISNGNTGGGIESIGYTVPAGMSQTFSVYVRPGNCHVYLQAASVSKTVSSEKSVANGMWQRLFVTYENDTSSPVTVTYRIVSDDTGIFYADNAQIEEGTAANRYNLIEGGDFCYGRTFLNASDESLGEIVTLTESAAPQMDTHVLKVTGDYASERRVSQTVAVTGNAGDYYTVAGWAKGDSVPLRDRRSFAVIGQFQYTGGTWSQPFIASFNPASESWQYTATGMIAERNYEKIRITLAYDENANEAYFDGIQLYRDGFGYTYSYDEENHVISKTSSKKQTDTFTYQENNLTREMLHTGSELEYTYDDYHNVLTATTEEGLTYHFTYDTWGNNTAVSISAETETLSTSAAYSADGNRLISTTDAKGDNTTYHYNEDTNLLQWVRYPGDTEETKTVYTYDSMYRPVSSACTSDTGETFLTAYERDLNGYLTGLSSQSTDYSFSYGVFGLRTAVAVGDRTLSAYVYSNDRNHYLTRLNYGNGDYTAYTRDEKGRILTETNENGETVSYTYDQSGALTKVEDSDSGTETTVSYDYIGRTNTYRKVNEAIDMRFTYEYNEDNLLSGVRDVYNGHTRGISYSYDEDRRVTEFSHARGYRFYNYDAFDRISSYTTKFRRASDETLVNAITTTFGYETLGTGEVTGLVESVRQQGSSFDDTFTYTYDANGNILSVSDGTFTTTYVYDSLNQLLRENNQRGGFTHTWSYDNAGNILERKAYAYTTGDLENLNPQETVTYTYGDASWGDLLTAYDGQSITYDGIGNPLSDGTWNYTWESGRELSSMSKAGTAWDFTYDENGYRTKRTDGQTTYDYAYTDGLLRYMEINGTPYYFTYAPDGTPMGIVEDDTPYFFELNLQGDIVGITSYTGYRVVEYTYDAWGNLLSCTGTRANTIGKRNPLRYRGYVYDEETGLYYVSSRYYDPEVGRFINADEIDYLGADEGLLSYNLFTYCLNNPVNRTDEGGNLSAKNWIKIGIGVVALAAAVVLTVYTGGGAAAVAVGVAKIVGSVALSTATSAGLGYLTNGKEGAIDGACNGFMLGSLSACGGAAVKFSQVKAATTGTPNSIGKAGEKMAGIDPKAKQQITINGRTRIPDALSNTTLSEVKNVKYISNTQQLRDFADFAKSTGRSMDLYVRPTTRIAKTVIDAGWNIKYLW